MNGWTRSHSTKTLPLPESSAPMTRNRVTVCGNINIDFWISFPNTRRTSHAIDWFVTAVSLSSIWHSGLHRGGYSGRGRNLYWILRRTATEVNSNTRRSNGNNSSPSQAGGVAENEEHYCRELLQLHAEPWNRCVAWGRKIMRILRLRNPFHKNVNLPRCCWSPRGLASDMWVSTYGIIRYKDW